MELVPAKEQARLTDVVVEVWSSLGEYLDLPKSSSYAVRYYQAQAGYATEKLFWSQFGVSKRPLLLNE